MLDEVRPIIETIMKLQRIGSDLSSFHRRSNSHHLNQTHFNEGITSLFDNQSYHIASTLVTPPVPITTTINTQKTTFILLANHEPPSLSSPLSGLPGFLLLAAQNVLLERPEEGGLLGSRLEPSVTELG